MRTLLGLILLIGLLATGCSPAAKGPSEKGPDGGKGPAKILDVEIDPDALPQFDVTKGNSAKHKIKVLRQQYKGDLALEFDVPADAGLKLEASAIPAGRNEVEITVTAQPDAKGGKVTIKASAPDHKPVVLIAPEIWPK